MLEEIPLLDKTGLRNFGLTTGTIVAGLFGLLIPWLFNFNYPYWPWVLSGFLWVIAVLFPSGLQPIYKSWMTIGLILGWVNTRIILAILFYLVFFPTGFVMRIFGKDPMLRKMNRDLKSYRRPSTYRHKNQVEKPY